MTNPLKRWQARRRPQAIEDLQQEVGLRLNRVIEARREDGQERETESLWLSEPFKSITAQNVAYGQHFQAM